MSDCSSSGGDGGNGGDMMIVDDNSLETYLGKPRFSGETIYEASVTDMIPGKCEC